MNGEQVGNEETEIGNLYCFFRVADPFQFDMDMNPFLLIMDSALDRDPNPT